MVKYPLWIQKLLYYTIQHDGGRHIDCRQCLSDKGAGSYLAGMAVAKLIFNKCLYLRDRLRLKTAIRLSAMYVAESASDDYSF